MNKEGLLIQKNTLVQHNNNNQLNNGFLMVYSFISNQGAKNDQEGIKLCTNR